MNRVPDSELVLVPGGTLITTPEQGRAFAFTMARHSIQPDLDVLRGDRPHCSTDPGRLVTAADNYWRS